MREKKHISLLAAILININIIIGAGVFLNVKPLIKIAGPLCFLSYLLGAAILLPFVYSLAKLAAANPASGGLYIYGKKYLNPFLGFLSGWVYFVGKTVSAAFLAYAFTSFFQHQFIFLQSRSPLFLTSIVIFSLILLNIAGAHIGGPIQYIFFSIKIIPILFALIFGLTILQPTYFYGPKVFSHLISTIPIALYPLMGFEVTCSIGHMIKNPKKNIFWAITGSFMFTTIIYILFQGVLFGALGAGALGYEEPLMILGNKLFVYPIIGQFIIALVFTSVISGSFGILTSNCWNLHALAKDNHLPGKKWLTKVSKQHVPWVSLLFQGAIACILLIMSQNQIALQSMSVFGAVFSFLLSALAAYKARNKIKIAQWVPMLAISSCSYILFLCFQKMIFAGVSIPYIVLLLAGVLVSLKR